MITEIYSKRQKRLRGEFPDVYQYKTIPKELRVTINYIWKDFWSDFFEDDMVEEIFEDLDEDDVVAGWDILWSIDYTLCREYGLESLSQNKDVPECVWDFFYHTKDIERAIDVIELLFQGLENESRPPLDNDQIRTKFNAHKAEAIKKLNTSFREYGVGCQYESGEIIRVDSQYIHSKAVRPVLSLLSDAMYKSANEEFLKAHKHYRKGDYKSCIHECSNAFESVLKVICDNKGWEYTEKATAKPLLDIVYQNGLLPKYKKSFFDNVRCVLESGIPTIRNNISGHGHGSKEVAVPDYMAEHMLNLTASSILLLVKANKDT